MFRHWCFLTCNCTKAKKAQREAELEKEEQKRKISSLSKEDSILQNPALQNGPPVPVCTADIFSGTYSIHMQNHDNIYNSLRLKLPASELNVFTKKKCISLYDLDVLQERQGSTQLKKDTVVFRITTSWRCG